MNNTRFATVIHILTLLAQNKNGWMSSEFIAGSININPVIVRKELVFLQGEGWIITKKGKDGGTMLGCAASSISLASIYKALKNNDALGKKNLNPNPECPVGKSINSKLEYLFEQVDQELVLFLSNKSLADFALLFA